MGHHCQSCTCDPDSDTRLFLRYEQRSDSRDVAQQGNCTSCKTHAPVVVVQYASGARRYYCEECARNVVGWRQDAQGYDSTKAEALLVAKAQLDAEVITLDQYLAVFDANS